jgi:two-component system, NtrC family, response regulator AtoC
MRDGDLDGVLTNGEAIAACEDEQTYLSFPSPAMRSLERIIAEIAPTDIPVLLVGESGSGKEVLAQQIHRLSQRRDEQLRKLVCAGLASEAIERMMDENGTNGSGLRGPSTGTVFLDEVSDLDLNCQPTLLHVLPDGSSASGERWLAARIISSTVKNLEEEIRNGRFREELYYRLNGACLRLPPLRHRKQDIPPLVEFFSERYARQLGRPKPSVNPATMARLTEYAWPGNIRQLKNAVMKIVALGNADLALTDFDAGGHGSGASSGGYERFSLKEASRAASRQAERELILKALEKTHWNRKRAARDLRISYKALLYKLKQIGVEDSGRT